MASLLSVYIKDGLDYDLGDEIDAKISCDMTILGEFCDSLIDVIGVMREEMYELFK